MSGTFRLGRPRDRARYRSVRTGETMVVQWTSRTTWRMLRRVEVVKGSDLTVWEPYMSFDTQDSPECFTSRFTPEEENTNATE